MQMMLFSCKEAKKERKTKNDVDRPGLQVLAATHTHTKENGKHLNTDDKHFSFFVCGGENERFLRNVGGNKRKTC